MALKKTIDWKACQNQLNKIIKSSHSDCEYSAVIAISGGSERAEKVYYINKALNEIEAFYADELPAIFSMEYPLGTVFGRAKYGNYLFFYQSCTIEESWFESKMYYPVLGEHVTMFSRVKILGNSHMATMLFWGLILTWINCDIPDYAFVFPSSDARKPIIVFGKKEEILNREKNFWK